MGTSNFGAEAAPSWLTPANLTNPEAEPNRVHVAIRSGKSWSTVLNPALQGLTGKKQSEAKEYLGDLTYLETQQLVFALARPADDVLDTFKDAAERGTMKRKSGEKTWKQICENEQVHIRLPVAPQVL